MTDTNYFLQELRDLFSMTERHQPMHTRMRIAELFERLDTELSNGGRMPDAWAEAIRPQLREPIQSHHCTACGGNHTLPLCREARYRCNTCHEKFSSVLALADHRLSKDH